MPHKDSCLPVDKSLPCPRMNANPHTRRFFVSDLSGEEAKPHPNEVHHALHVLRLKSGDEVELFDGAGTVSARETDGNVTVAFTARRAESQNADDYLVARVRAVRDASAAIWLVTEDYGLRHRAHHACDAFITPLHFHAFARGTARA